MRDFVSRQTEGRKISRSQLPTVALPPEMANDYESRCTKNGRKNRFLTRGSNKQVRRIKQQADRAGYLQTSHRVFVSNQTAERLDCILIPAEQPMICEITSIGQRLPDPDRGAVARPNS